MCDLKQPKPTSGPTLCKAGQELVVRCVMQGDRNNQVRAALKREGHYHDLSDNGFSPYRKLPIVKEARMSALANMRDVGVVALARRIDVLEAGIQDQLARSRKTKDITESATAFRAGVAGCKEISRLVDLIDPDGLDGIPNNGETANAPVSIEQVLAAFRALTERKKQGKLVAQAVETAQAEVEARVE